MRGRERILAWAGAMIVALFLTSCATSCAPLPPPVPIEAVCSATDGDTLRCGEERIRLLGIDSPEMAGHCREGRACAPGDPLAAQRSLAEALASGRLTIVRVKKDRYGRTLGVVNAGAVNLSCRQLEAGAATYRPDWDDRGLVRGACPDLTR